MRLPVSSAATSIDFAELGQLLDRLDGETVRVGLAFLHGRSRRRSRHAQRDCALLGGASGRLHVATADEVDADVGHSEYKLPSGAVAPHERAYLLEIGNFTIAFGGAEFVGGSSDGRMLRLQVGPVLVSMALDDEHDQPA